MSEVQVQQVQEQEQQVQGQQVQEQVVPELHATPEQVKSAMKYVFSNLGLGLVSDDYVSEFKTMLDTFYVTKDSVNRQYKSIARSMVVKHQVGPKDKKIKTNIPIWIVKSICVNSMFDSMKLSDIFTTPEFKEEVSKFTGSVGSHYMKMIRTENIDLSRIKPSDLDSSIDTNNLLIFEIKRKVEPEEIAMWKSRNSRGRYQVTKIEQ